MIYNYTGTYLIMYSRCCIEKIGCLLYINYEINDVYNLDPFKHSNDVLHYRWS